MASDGRGGRAKDAIIQPFSISYSSPFFWINEVWSLQYIVFVLELIQINFLRSQRIGETVSRFRQSSATATDISNGTVWCMQSFLFQLAQLQHQDYRIIEQHGAQCSSLIKQETCFVSGQSLAFMWCLIRCNMDGSGEIVGIFFTIGNCCSSGWLHVFSVTITLAKRIVADPSLVH